EGSADGGSGVGSMTSSPNSSTVSVSVSSTVSSPVVSSQSEFSSTAPNTTMAFNSMYTAYRPRPVVYSTTNPLYGPIPPPTLGFQTLPSYEQERYTPPRVTAQPLTNASVMSLRQQMDESNHDM
ncbi:hypothetical protein A2U01_0059796, partial [Trifolium medium]|nr:hypothetical protein [Trifolium medium]